MVVEICIHMYDMYSKTCLKVEVQEYGGFSALSKFLSSPLNLNNWHSKV